MGKGGGLNPPLNNSLFPVPCSLFPVPVNTKEKFPSTELILLKSGKNYYTMPLNILTDMFPFRFTIDTVAIAGSCIWSLALYLGMPTLREWIIEQLERWFNFADRSLYISTEEFEKSRPARESQNAFYASAIGIVPFLVLGALFNWGIESSLGRSWAVSIGMLATITFAVYELGRRDSQ